MSATDKTKLDSLLVANVDDDGVSPITVVNTSGDVTISHNKISNNINQNYSRGENQNKTLT